MLIYILYFVFIAILAIQYEFIPFKNNYLLFAAALLLALLAGFRGMDVSRDYYNYQYSFDNIYEFTSQGNLNYFLILEPGFVAVVFFFRHLFESNYGLVIMLFFAISGMFMKTTIIRKFSINPYLTLLFYYSYFFIFYEMAQVRIGLASGIFFISLPSLLKGNRKTYFLLILIATLFHYSAIFYLALLLFDVKEFNKKIYWSALALSIVLAFVHLPLLKLLENLNTYDIGKINSYVEAAANEMTINVFSFSNLCNIFCCSYIMSMLKPEAINSDKKLILFLKCNILSIFILSFLSSAPAIDLRISQLFGIVEIFLFAYLVKFLPFKKYNVFILILIAACFLYITAFYGHILKTYKTIPIQ